MPRSGPVPFVVALAGLIAGLVALAAVPSGPPASNPAASFASEVAASIAATTPDRVVTLDNGLIAVLRADRSQPVVAVQMYYRVGARHETIGITGIAHYLEHMLFRGTENFGLADVTGVIERAGGEWHGYTWLDGTTYFEAAPKALLPTLLRLEAERMTVARMVAAEVEPERGAVFQEYRGYQLDPRSDLFDAVMAILFLQHPYRNNTMGWESDLAGITHADLVDFYERYYAPGNAVLAIAGDLDLDAMEREVRAVFGGLAARGDEVATRTVEPPVEGTRRVTLERAAASPALLISFLAPAATRPREYATLLVLDAILDGARGLSFYHHSGDLTAGREADPGTRLAALVAAGPAQSLGTAFVPMVYPGHWSIYATPRAGRSLAEIESAIAAALAVAARSITTAEVDAARRLILAADRVEIDSPLEVAHEMAFWTAIGGPTARRAVLEALATVRLEEVRGLAARTTLEHAAIGWLVPAGSPAGAPSAADQKPAAAGPTPPGRPGCGSPASSADLKPAARTEVTTQRITLPGGHEGDPSSPAEAVALVDARVDLPTFAMRVAIAPPAAGTPPEWRHRLRAAAARLAGDDEARAHAAACGVSLEVLAPGEGRFDERDTLQIETTGPAGALGAAIDLLGAAVPPSLWATPATEEAPSTHPEAVALSRLGAAVQRAGPASSGAGSPGVDLLAARIALAIVAPYDPQSLAVRTSGLATRIQAAIRRYPAAPPTPALLADPRGGAGGARRPFEPGRSSVTLPGIPQGRLLIAVPGDADPIVQDAVAWLLHHNYGGRLGAKAIAETGRVYEMDSESSRRGAPLTWFSMGADPVQLDALEADMARVLEGAASGFGEAEVAGYRSYAAGRPVVRLAHPDQAARLWTSVLLRGGDARTPGREAARAASLTLESIRKAAARMLDPKRRLSVIVGREPVPGK